MANIGTKISRRQQILSALAKMLQESPGERITTAVLAKSVGVSEAALYRHFPSKTKMFEGLIEFIEEAIFSQISIILEEEKTALNRCNKIVLHILTFAEQNPGFSRLLIGDALTGETERLQDRMVNIFQRLETVLMQILIDGELRENIQYPVSVNAAVHFLMAYVDGCVVQFVRSKFEKTPQLFWQEQWSGMIEKMLQPQLAVA